MIVNLVRSRCACAPGRPDIRCSGCGRWFGRGGQADGLSKGLSEDFQAGVEGRKISERLDYAMIVPGSGLVKAQAEAEGLDKIFTAAGFEWREPGCSMCLGMNPDQLKPGQRCASTSNRNFEGRQGYRGRTHLVSPKMAAAAALEGHFVDVRNWSSGA